MKKVSRIMAMTMALALMCSAAFPVFAAPSKKTEDVTPDQVVQAPNVFDSASVTVTASDEKAGVKIVVMEEDKQTEVKAEVPAEAIKFAKEIVKDVPVAAMTVHKAFELTIDPGYTIPAEGLTVTLTGIVIPKDEDFIVMHQLASGEWEVVPSKRTANGIEATFKSLSPVVVVTFKSGETSTSPKTGESFPVAAAVAVVALCGAAFCVKKYASKA